MLSQQSLQEFLTRAAQLWPDHIAIEEPGKGYITYRDLDNLSNLLRDRLNHLGVSPGDRVGVYLHKSIDSVATIFGILKTGAAYTPVDPDAPVDRNAYILSDCAVKAAVIERGNLEKLIAKFGGEGPALISLEGTGCGHFLKKFLDEAPDDNSVATTDTVISSPSDLAYILYTSGSTGKPKGVMLSHRAATSFVNWCSEVIQPVATDRFSSHAPFHFDLSILDIYLSIKHGATLVLIDESLGKEPLKLARLIAEKKITSWYSTPSILSLLAQYGRLERYDFSELRTVLFAGEVFPIKHLHTLKNLLPKPRYFNLYGPTETNVCTYYQIPDAIDGERTRPYPIGVACSHYNIKVIDEDGMDVGPGKEGELCAAGLGVMDGYWNLPERTANAFLIDSNGRRWYKTGDIVVEEADGNYTYVGRRDRMVKKRGYRVELGEVEAGLYRHPAIKEAAVIALSDEEYGVRLKAYLSFNGEDRPSLIELKRFCMDNLPNYMVPDLFSFHEILPKTSTDKINYQQLKQM